MSARRVAVTALATTLAVAAVSSPVRAAAPSADAIERARQLDENARTLYDEGSYEGAILAWKKAYELTEYNNLLYNISMAYDRSGDFEQALEYLDRYRAFAPPEERPQLERKKKSLQVRLDKQREDAAAAAEPDPSESDPPPPPPTDPVAMVPPPQPLFNATAWALTATAGVGFGLALGFGVASLVKTKRATDGCVDAGSGIVCATEVERDVAQARTYAIVADVGIAVGAVATSSLIAVLVIRHRQRKTQSKKGVQFATVPIAGGGAVSLSGRF